MNFTTITVPNLRYPPIDTYIIPSVESNQVYEIRLSTYSNLGVSPMSNSIEISVPKGLLICSMFSFLFNRILYFLVTTEHRSRTNQINSTPNVDEVLENITRIQYASHMKHNLITPSINSTQKSSDMLYLIIGIIAGVLLILLLILIAMCVLRLLQQKKLIGMFKKNFLF